MLQVAERIVVVVVVVVVKVRGGRGEGDLGEQVSVLLAACLACR